MFVGEPAPAAERKDGSAAPKNCTPSGSVCCLLLLRLRLRLLLLP